MAAASGIWWGVWWGWWLWTSHKGGGCSSLQAPESLRPLWFYVRAASFSWSWCWAQPWATPTTFASKGWWGRDHSIPAALTRDHNIPASLTRDGSISAALTRDHSINQGPQHHCSVSQEPQHPRSINQGPQHPRSINQAAFSELFRRETAPCSDFFWPPYPCMADMLHFSHLSWTAHRMNGPRAWLCWAIVEEAGWFSWLPVRVGGLLRLLLAW